MLVRRAILVALAMLALAACGGADPEGNVIGPLRCLSEQADEGVLDYAADAEGHATIAEAIEAWEGDHIWSLRDDWRGLTQGPTDSYPVEFRDGRGWLYLNVDLEQRNGAWFVTAYTSCSPG